MKITIDRKALFTLASETRINLLKELDKRRMTQSELSKELGMSKTAVKEHLDKLEEAGLVERSDEGRKWIYYQLTGKGKYVLHPGSKITITLMLSTAIAAIGGGFFELYRYVVGKFVMGPTAPLPTPEPAPVEEVTPTPTPQPTTPPEQPVGPEPTPSPTPMETPIPETPVPIETGTPEPIPTGTPPETPTPAPTSTPPEVPTAPPAETPVSTPTPEPVTTPTATPAPTPTGTPVPEAAQLPPEIH